MKRTSRLAYELVRMVTADKSVLTIPAGKTLFHGTIEQFEDSQLDIGGYDRLLWLTEFVGIAQSYIPRSGLSVTLSPDNIRLPSQDPDIQAIQHYIGIDYDLSEVKFDSTGRSQSWRRPLVNGVEYEGMLEGDEVDQLLKAKGFQPKRESYSPRYNMYEILMDREKIIPPGQSKEGRLFILTTKQPLRILDMTRGGETEGDLMDLDYHKLKHFEMAEKRGFDGVKINDFAQVHEWGNVGHTSIGIVRRSISKLEWKAIPAHHPDFEAVRTHPQKLTPEYEQYLKGQ